MTVLFDWASEGCEGCDGSGTRAPASPSCDFQQLERGWFIVERCDYCEQYDDDLAAANAWFSGSKTIRCTAGGWHVIARGNRNLVSNCQNQEM